MCTHGRLLVHHSQTSLVIMKFILSHVQALIESARSSLHAGSSPGPVPGRRGSLGPVTLHLPVASPFWKVLLGLPVTFDDLADLDLFEHSSLKALLESPLEEGTLFETFEMTLHRQEQQATQQLQAGRAGARDGAEAGGAGGRGLSVHGGAGVGLVGAERAVGESTLRLVPAGPYKQVRLLHARGGKNEGCTSSACVNSARHSVCGCQELCNDLCFPCDRQRLLHPLQCFHAKDIMRF